MRLAWFGAGLFVGILALAAAETLAVLWRTRRIVWA